MEALKRQVHQLTSQLAAEQQVVEDTKHQLLDKVKELIKCQKQLESTQKTLNTVKRENNQLRLTMQKLRNGINNFRTPYKVLVDTYKDVVNQAQAKVLKALGPHGPDEWTDWRGDCLAIRATDFVEPPHFKYTDFFERVWSYKPSGYSSFELGQLIGIAEPPIRSGTEPYPWPYWLYWNPQPPSPNLWGLLHDKRERSIERYDAAIPSWIMDVYIKKFSIVENFIDNMAKVLPLLEDLGEMNWPVLPMTSLVEEIVTEADETQLTDADEIQHSSDADAYVFV